VALMLAGWSRLRRRVDRAGSTALMIVALLLEVGHFRPDNIQAYTAPLGVYVLGGALLAALLEASGRGTRAFGIAELVAVMIMGRHSCVARAQRLGLRHYPARRGLALFGIAVMRRRLLLCSSAGFVVANGLHYLFFSSIYAPGWVMLATAGTLVMAAGYPAGSRSVDAFGRQR
jgi:hypothetical protein